MSKGAGLAVVVSWALFLAGCGTKQSVSLGGSVIDPELAVDQQALGTFLTGSFGLNLRLGKFAADPITVESPSFTLVDGDSGVELGVGPLSAVAPDASFPLEINPGGEVTVAFELDGSDPIAADAVDELCAAPVSVVATVPHSLDGGSTTTATSPALTPAGCP
jgi:hypothetical protein